MQHAELWICCVDTLTIELMKDHEYMRGIEHVGCKLAVLRLIFLKDL